MKHHFTKHNVCLFIGGAVAGLVGAKAAKSDSARKAAVKVMAGGMKLQEDAVTAYETIKEDAQDLHHEAKAAAAAKEDE